ncbi:MAG: hypothetical protein ACOY9Y_02305 [Bacillota bacterium]
MGRIARKSKKKREDPVYQPDHFGVEQRRDLKSLEAQFRRPLVRVDIKSGDILERNDKFWAEWRGDHASATQAERSQRPGEPACPIEGKAGSKRRTEAAGIPNSARRLAV